MISKFKSDNSVKNRLTTTKFDINLHICKHLALYIHEMI
jgi:hypothetical protein